MRNRKKDSDVKMILANIAITFLAIVLFICIIIMSFSLRVRSSSYVEPVRSLTGDIRRADYMSLVSAWKNNIKNGETAEKNSDFAEVYAVAEYYDRVFMYRIYTEKGYEAEAEETADRLKDCKENMGKLDYLADDFQTIFGLK